MSFEGLEINWDAIKSFFASLTVKKVVPGLLILVVGMIAAKLLLKLFDRMLQRSKLDRTIFAFLRAVMRTLLYAIIVLIAASSLGIDVTSLVAVLSVVSLAITLAVQNVLANVVGGVTLLMTHPFRVGETIQVGEDIGTVKEIGIHYTKLLTFNGELIYIPNSDTVSARIYNYSAEGKRRIELDFTASYADSMDLVKEAILKAADHPKVLAEPKPQVLVKEYSDSSICYRLLVWTAPEDYLETKFGITEEVKRKFDEKGITIPFPQMDVHLDK